MRAGTLMSTENCKKHLFACVMKSNLTSACAGAIAHTNRKGLIYNVM